jgi:hypothetical protein
MLKVVENATGGEAGEQFSDLHEIIRMGERRMLMATLETEEADYCGTPSSRAESGRANGAQGQGFAAGGPSTAYERAA